LSSNASAGTSVASRIAIAAHRSLMDVARDCSARLGCWVSLKLGPLDAGLNRDCNSTTFSA
jgi:hypothetical protein